MNEILTCLLVVGLIGLIAGILLVLASHFMMVREDETVGRLRECLPGANCGACGFTGCDGYARALGEGKAEPNLCIPGGNETARQIGEILGLQVEAVEAKIAVVHCNGTCTASPARAQYDGMESCRAVAMLFGGPGACRYGCLGCGDCAAVCPTGAICMADGVARIDSRICIGCKKCVETCPKEIISLVPRSGKSVVLCSSRDPGAAARKACANACIGCRKCERSCPEGAISVAGNLAVIDYARCSGCGLCAESCPTGCLKAADFSLAGAV